VRILLPSISGLLLILAIGPRPATGGPPATPEEIDAAWTTGDCARCHVVPDHAEEPRVRNCTTCHEWVRDVSASPKARARALELFPDWERYERNVRSYLPVPSLAAAMARLEPSWVDGYLADPHDLRPRLGESMPRFDLSAAERQALVQAFAAARVPVPSTPAPDPVNLSSGEELFVSKGCIACHGYGARHAIAPLPMAPDLAHTRTRMSADGIAAWIADPTAISSEATMPKQSLTPAEVLVLRDYILLADPAWTPSTATASLPEPATEPVTWARVNERVFGRICVHCHMAPELNEGRAGPGNAGGFGWAATGIELQTRAGVMAVADKIPDALLRRRQEAARDVVAPGQKPAELHRPDLPGMPLGLEPIDDADTALVLAWIAQGMPE